MPPPRIRGATMGMPGFVDVETDLGVMPMPETDPDVAALQQAAMPINTTPVMGGPGASAPLAEGPSAQQQLSDMFSIHREQAAQPQTPVMTDAASALAPQIPQAPARGTRLNAAPSPPVQPAERPRAVYNDNAQPGSGAPANMVQGYIDNALANRNQPRGRGGPVTRTTQTLNRTELGPMSEQQAATMQAAGQQAAESREDVEDIAFDRADVRSGLRQEYAGLVNQARGEQSEQQQRFDAQRDELNRRRQQRQEMFDRRRQEVAQMEVDPERYFRDEDGEISTGKKVFAALTAALGGIGAAMSGGSNEALGIIQTQVDRDIASQREAIANARTDLGEQRGIIADLVQEGLSIDEAERMGRALIWENVERQMAELEHLAQSEEHVLAADEIRAASRANQAAAVQAQVAEDVGTVTTEQTQRRSTGGGPRRQSLEQIVSEAQAMQTLANMRGGVQNVSEVDADDLRRYGEAQAGREMMDQARRELRELTQEGEGVEGVGSIQGMLPDSVQPWVIGGGGAQGQRIRAALQRYNAGARRMISGTASSEQEAANIQRAYLVQPHQAESQFFETLDRMDNQARRDDAMIRSRFQPDVVNAYDYQLRQYGGETRPANFEAIE